MAAQQSFVVYLPLTHFDEDADYGGCGWLGVTAKELRLAATRLAGAFDSRGAPHRMEWFKVPDVGAIADENGEDAGLVEDRIGLAADVKVAALAAEKPYGCNFCCNRSIRGAGEPGCYWTVFGEHDSEVSETVALTHAELVELLKRAGEALDD